MYKTVRAFVDQVNNEAATTFFAEGIQKWYEYTQKDAEKKRGLEKAREFADEDLTEVICGKTSFYQGEKYYLISGIFTNYLIDIYGLNRFKELYKYSIYNIDVLQGFIKIYGKPLSEILANYRNWLLPSEAEN